MENVNDSLKLFIEYLQIEKNYSKYTIENYQQDIKEFCMFMTEQSIGVFSNVQYSDARLYLTKLYERKLARKTIARRISSLRSLYKFLLREELIQDNPFSLVAIPKIEKRLPEFFYEEELEQLFNSCEVETPIGQRNKALLELLYATGIRVSECCQIRLKDIDFTYSTVLIHGKGSKDRYMPFGSFASDSLNRYIKDGRTKLLTNNHSHDFLFVNYRGGAITERGVRNVLNTMFDKTALTGKIHPHMLRHTFATHLLNNGADMRSVQELLGHAYLSSTQVYTHVTNDYLRKTYLNHHPRA
ncbi:MAG TPA: tyrosine recombinase XerC [Pseudoneobacillus sp.]|nr:tyrosine recombinase XerC [Pseudoneobacillus sp.]